jgi:sialidase-1
VIDLPLRGAMEASVAELSSGRLVMSLRTQLGAVFLCSSADQGETWSLPQTTGLKAPESCTCLRRIPGTDALLLLWNDSLYDPRHHHFGRRTPLSAAVSTDEGRTWRRLGNVDGGNVELTNLSCTFTHAGTAVVTYLRAPGPSPGSGPNARFTREGIDLMAAVIQQEWLLAQI